MKIRLAKKIEKRCYESLQYIIATINIPDLSKKPQKAKKYWEYRWFLYFADDANMDYGRKDHRIVKAQILYARWCARKQINELIVYTKASPFRYRDLSSFTKILKKYRV